MNTQEQIDQFFEAEYPEMRHGIIMDLFFLSRRII